MIPKFRAAYKDKIFEVTEIKFCQGKLSYVAGHDGTRWYYVEYSELNDLVLMQSTGLKDKNGVEIFKGDVIKYKQGNYIRNYEVFWDDQGAKFMAAVYGYSFMADFFYEGEIIGNIHQHKELLEEEAQEETK